jgi:hypothetical protein
MRRQLNRTMWMTALLPPPSKHMSASWDLIPLSPWNLAEAVAMPLFPILHGLPWSRQTKPEFQAFPR